MHNFYISGSISIETFDAFQFFWQNIKEDKRDKSISIYINSNGGCTVSTLAIVRQLLTMSNMGYTIHTFGQKNVASGAFIIFLCGDTGQRVLAQGTKLLFHRGRKPIYSKFELKEDTNVKGLLRNKFSELGEVILFDNKAKNAGIAKLRRGFLTKLAGKRMSINGVVIS